MTSQGAEDEITKVCEQEKKNLMLQQSESKKNLLVNFNQVHTYSEWFQFVMKWDFFELFWILTHFRSSRREVFYKKVFLEISQISQENTCASFSFLIIGQYVYCNCYNNCTLIIMKMLRTQIASLGSNYWLLKSVL